MNAPNGDAISPELKAQVAQAIRDEFAVTTWKPQDRILMTLECPSGQKILLRHLTTMDLLEADLIEEIDFFTKRLFPESIDQGGTPVEHPEEDENASVWVLLRDVNKRARFFSLLNRIMVVGVVKPKIIDDGVKTYTNKEGKTMVRLGTKKIEPKDGEALASSIDFADRMAIFAELNKPLDQIKPFRRESAFGLANMESVQGTASKAK